MPQAGVDGRDVGWLLDRHEEAGGDSTFLTWVPFEAAPRSWTFREFHREVRALAVGLRSRGISEGSRVVLVLDNDPAFVLCWAAILRVGAVAVCLNTRSSVDELAYFGEHSGAVAAVVHARYAADVATAMPALQWTLVVDGPGDGVGELLGDPEDFRPVTLDRLAPASIQYTSGTTARPKAVVWTHANCVWAAEVNARHQQLTAADVYLLHLPLFHTNALSYSLLGSFWAGGAIVLQPRFSASRFWEVALAYRCTWSSVVSFCLKALAPRAAPTAHHFRGWANSYVVPAGTGPGGVAATGWFGMTETVSHPICSGPAAPGAPASMGFAAPEYGVKVVDEDGADVPRGAPGQLLIRGEPGVSLFARYLHDDRATREAFTDDGWFRTGDRVRCESDGSIFFVERDKDVLKVGSENIGAPEIERVLLGVPGVTEAAVVGRPDEMLGEVPVAFVLVSGDSDELRRAIELQCSQMLAAFKRPRNVYVLEEFPRSTLDKVAKSVLRELAVALAGGA